ncbi:MAG: response regulator [bacterium]
MARVLIIEDCYEIRMMMRSFLIRKGHKIVDAKDGEKALEHINTEHPEVIVTDLRMPGKDGLDTIRELRKNGMDIPIIVATGYDEPFSQKEAQEFGISKILTKPVSATELINAVEVALKISKASINVPL